jgi:hypothetical protein
VAQRNMGAKVREFEGFRSRTLTPLHQPIDRFFHAASVTSDLVLEHCIATALATVYPNRDDCIVTIALLLA